MKPRRIAIKGAPSGTVHQLEGKPPEFLSVGSLVIPPARRVGSTTAFDRTPECKSEVLSKGEGGPLMIDHADKTSST